ncbi:MAG: hypothetical protein MJ078_05635, partial [Clostridia bacterium]|nr:hypothetical protein [Clostridia bacterium]
MSYFEGEYAKANGDARKEQEIMRRYEEAMDEINREYDAIKEEETQRQRVDGGEVSKQFGEDANHISKRTNQSVAKPSVKAFQFDHPELHNFFVSAAKALQHEVFNASGNVTVSKMNGRHGKISLSGNPLESLYSRMSLPEINKCLEDIIANNGQENYANAKRVELVLDQMMVDGWSGADRVYHPPVDGYKAARDAINGGIKTNSYEQYLRDNSLALETGEVTEEELRKEWEEKQATVKKENAITTSEKETKEERIARQEKYRIDSEREKFEQLPEESKNILHERYEKYKALFGKLKSGDRLYDPSVEEYVSEVATVYSDGSFMLVPTGEGGTPSVILNDAFPAGDTVYSILEDGGYFADRDGNIISSEDGKQVTGKLENAPVEPVSPASEVKTEEAGQVKSTSVEAPKIEKAKTGNMLYDGIWEDVARAAEEGSQETPQNVPESAPKAEDTSVPSDSGNGGTGENTAVETARTQSSFKDNNLTEEERQIPGYTEEEQVHEVLKDKELKTRAEARVDAGEDAVLKELSEKPFDNWNADDIEASDLIIQRKMAEARAHKE